MPSLDRTMPKSIILQKNNSSLNLHICYNVMIFFHWYLIVQLIRFTNKCMPTYQSPYILKNMEDFFAWKVKILWNLFVTVPWESCAFVISYIAQCHLKGLQSKSYPEFWKIIPIDWMIQIYPNLCGKNSKIIFHSINMPQVLCKLPL